MKTGVLKNFAKFTGKHLWQSLFFNKVAGLRHRSFPMNFAKFLRKRFYRTPPDKCLCLTSYLKTYLFLKQFLRKVTLSYFIF